MWISYTQFFMAFTAIAVVYKNALMASHIPRHFSKMHLYSYLLDWFVRHIKNWKSDIVLHCYLGNNLNIMAVSTIYLLRYKPHLI